MRFKKETLPPITINALSPVPLFEQIVEAIIKGIQTGRIAPGTPLPGKKVMAAHLHVSQLTVIGAYQKLMEQGWIEMRERSGTYVADPPPVAIPLERKPLTGSSKGSQLAFDMPTRKDLATSQMAYITKLSQGLPDPRLLPKTEMGLACRSALLPGKSMERRSPLGNPELRLALSQFLLERRNLSIAPDSILVTRGNRMAVNLLAKGLLDPGDIVAVENPGNSAAWECFRNAGAELRGIPVDADGMDPDALESLLRTKSIKLLYLSPRFQFPTTATLSAERRSRILHLARRHGFRIVEEDSEAEYTMEGPPTIPLASEGGTDEILYLNSFSILLAPGFRMGLLTGPPGMISNLADLSERLDGDSDPVMETALLQLLQSGQIQRHIYRVLKIYRERRDLAIACISELFEDRLDLAIPKGGLALWVRTNPSLDLSTWCQGCWERGIHFQPGQSCTLDRSAMSAFRLGFASFDPREMADILTKMRQAYP